MNKKLFWTLGLALVTSLSMQAQDDDLYFTPSKKKGQNMNATVTSVRSNQQSVSTTNTRPTLAVYNNNSRDEDEYNRRDANYAGAWQTGGGAQDSLIGRVDTVYVDTVYQTSPDMYDPESDFIYSRRLLRFHSPRFGYALSSPYYWDLVYGYGVYNYLYDPFYWDLYDPFYWDYGWGYGWSWRPWYSSFYGWHSPYYAWDYWGVGPYWHGAGHIYSNRFSNSRNRGTFSQSRYATETLGRTSAVAAANGSRNSFSSRTENSLRTSAATRSSSTNSLNRISTAGNTRTVFNGNTVSGNAAGNNNRVVVVNRNDNSRTSAVRQSTQQATTRVQTQTTNTNQRVTVPTTTNQQRTTVTAQPQQRTVVSVPQRSSAATSTTTRSSAATSSFSGSSTSSFGGGASSSFGGGGASAGSSGGGSRISGGRR